MEQTTPSRLSSPRDAAKAKAIAFGRWLRERMIERDYDLSARGGGQARLAEQTGLGRTTISRLLRGEVLTPDPDSLRRIAEALALPLGEVLIQAGLLTPTDLRTAETSATVTDRPPITPEQAADELGITDPIARRFFFAQVEAAQQLSADRKEARADD